jgi:hypothetical protein
MVGVSVFRLRCAPGVSVAFGSVFRLRCAPGVSVAFGLVFQ